MDGGSQRPSLFGVSVAVLCVALAVLDVALVRRNRELMAEVTELRGRLESPDRAPPPHLEGQPFPVLELTDPRGGHLGLTEIPESHATLLFVSTPACDYCELAAPIWERVHRRLAGTHLRVFELVLDPGDEDLGPDSRSFPLLTAGGADASVLDALVGTPATLLVDSSGVVLRAIYGGEQPGLEQTVEEFLEGSLTAD